MQPNLTTADPAFINQPWLSSERILAHVRSLIDVYFIGGGLLLVCAFWQLCCLALEGDWLWVTQMSWTFVCFAALIVVVVSASVSTKPRSRSIMQLSLAIYLISLAGVFIYSAGDRVLVHNYRFYYTCIGIAVWAILGLGVLCIEKRFAAKISLANPKPASNWLAVMIGRPFGVLLVAACLIMAIDVVRGCQMLLSTWPINTQLFSSQFSNAVIQWSFAVLSASLGTWVWLSISTAYRDRLYPVKNTATIHPHLLSAYTTIQVVAFLSFLLTFAVEGRHFSFVMIAAPAGAVSLWAHSKLQGLIDRKMAEKVAEGTRYIH